MLEQRLTPTQVAERREATAQIRHSTEMEGGSSSDATRELQDRWARGEINADELVQLTKDLHLL